MVQRILPDLEKTFFVNSEALEIHILQKTRKLRQILNLDKTV